MKQPGFLYPTNKYINVQRVALRDIFFGNVNPSQEKNIEMTSAFAPNDLNIREIPFFDGSSILTRTSDFIAVQNA